ncbi:hypothetical protein ES703_120956 [subsurface metagenome]
MILAHRLEGVVVLSPHVRDEVFSPVQENVILGGNILHAPGQGDVLDVVSVLDPQRPLHQVLWPQIAVMKLVWGLLGVVEECPHVWRCRRGRWFRDIMYVIKAKCRIRPDPENRVVAPPREGCGDEGIPFYRGSSVVDRKVWMFSLHNPILRNKRDIVALRAVRRRSQGQAHDFITLIFIGHEGCDIPMVHLISDCHVSCIEDDLAIE